MVVRDVEEEEVAVLTTEVDEDEEAIEKKKTYVTMALIPCKIRYTKYFQALPLHGLGIFIYMRVFYKFKL